MLLAAGVLPRLLARSAFSEGVPTVDLRTVLPTFSLCTFYNDHTYKRCKRGQYLEMLRNFGLMLPEAVLSFIFTDLLVVTFVPSLK